MGLKEFSGELDQPVLKEFAGELDAVPAPKLKEFSGELDPPSPQKKGWLTSFSETMGEIGDAITGRAGRRQQLEKRAGAGVFDKDLSDWELQQRIDAMPPRVGHQSMTAGPAAPQTFSQNLPLNMDSRPGEVASVAGDVLKAAPKLAMSGLGRTLVGAKRMANDLTGTAGNDFYDSERRNDLANLAAADRIATAGLSEGQAGAARNIGAGMEQTAAALLTAGLVKPGMGQLAVGMSLPESAKAYNELSDAGVKGPLLPALAAGKGAIAGGTEAIPMGMLAKGTLPTVRGIVNAAKGGSLAPLGQAAKYHAGAAAGEVVQELPATVLEHGADYIAGDPNATSDRLGKSLIETIKSMPLQILTQNTLMHGARGAGRMAGAALDRAAPQATIADAFASAVAETDLTPKGSAGDVEATRVMQPPSLRYDRSSPAPGASVTPIPGIVSPSETRGPVGMPMAEMQQGGKNLRDHAGELKGRTLAETLARIPEEARVISPDPTRTLSGTDFGQLDQDAPGEGFAPLRDRPPQQVNQDLRTAMIQSVNESGLPPELAAKIKLPDAAVWDKAMRLPAGVRYWYEKSAEGFARNFFALPGKLTERLIDMTAASSGNKKPYDNVKDGIAAMAQDAQGLPVTVGFRDPTSVTKALSDDEIDTHKFGNFSGTMQMVARTRDGKPLPTIDLQMAKMFGLSPQDVASDPRMYETLARYVMKIRDMQNQYLQPGQQPYESWQVQALGWVNQRDSADPDDYASAMPKILQILQDAGIPTPGGKITEETLLDPRTPAVLAPTSKLSEGMTGTVETQTVLTPEGKRAADVRASLDGRPEAWARKAREEYEAIQRRAMKAIGNKRKNPKGLDTKIPSMLANLYSLVTGNSLGSWDVSRIDFDGYGTFEGAVGPNVRIPMVLSPRGGGRDRVTLSPQQAKSVLAVIGKAFDQAAMAASSFESVPLGRHDTFSIFIHRTDGAEMPADLLGSLEQAVGWPLNYQTVPNGWQIDINKFDPSTPPLDERNIHDAISPILAGHEVTLIPRAYDSIFIEASEYDSIIKETENEILGRGNAGRGGAPWGGAEQHRDFLAVAEALRATATSQAEALSAWADGVESKAAGKQRKVSKAGLPTGELQVRGEFGPETGTLGIPRSEMPQIRIAARPQFVAAMEQYGVERGVVQADSLKPTQLDFDTDKTDRAKGLTDDRSDKSAVIVSSDGYVLDGHHRWMAKSAAGQDINVIRVNLPIRQLIGVAHNFAKAHERTVKRENYKLPPAEAVVGPDVIREARDFIKRYPAPPEIEVSKEDMERAIAIVTPIVEAAAKQNAAFSDRVFDVAEAAGSLGVLIGPVKKIDRTARKLALPDEANWDTESLRDIVRATVVVSDYAEADSVVAEIRKRFEVVPDRIKNRTNEKVSGPDVSDKGFLESGYGDVLVNVLINGVQAEIQINVPEMISVKNAEGHKLYEIERELPKGPEQDAVKAAEKRLYGAASLAASRRNSSSGMTAGSDIGMRAGRNAPSSWMNNAPSGNSTNNRPGSDSRNLQPSGNTAGTFISSPPDGSVSHPGNTDLVQMQSGAGFAYGDFNVTDASAGLTTQYKPKLSEQAMDRRSLQPLEPEQAAVIDSAIADLTNAGRVPMAWAKGVTYYALKPMAAGYANYNPADSSVGVKFSFLDQAGKDLDVARYIRGWVAHELHHFIDNYRNSSDRMFYLSAESPRMHMTTSVAGKFYGHGDLASEVLSIWNDPDTKVPDGLLQFLTYPMMQAQAMAGNRYEEEAVAFAKVELFAQMGAIYATNPAMMEEYLPQWFGFFKEWNNARGDGSVERSRVTLRNLLQKSVPDQRNAGGERGDGLARGSLAAGGGGSPVGTRGSGVGAGSPAGGVRGASPVLPASAKATAGQEALKRFWGNQPPSRAKVPADNHIPTHVNYSTFSDAKGLHSIYSTMSRDFEQKIQEQRRGTIAIEQSYKEARELISDESGISQDQIDKMMGRQAGTAAGAAEILARMAILESAASEVDRLSREIAGKGALMISEKDALEFAAALDRAAMAHATFLGARAEIGRAMNAIKHFQGMAYDIDEVSRVLKTYSGKDGLAKVAEAIAGAGAVGGGGNGRRNVGVLLGVGGTGGRASAIGKIAKAASDPTLLDAAIEAWKAGLLSAPPTHLANLIGNAIFTGMRIPTHAIAGVVGTFARGDERARMGETIAMMLGATHGLAQGLRAAWEVVKDEDATFGPTPTEERQHAIAAGTFGAKGKVGALIDYIGKAVRVPFRGLSAGDAVFKMTNMYMSLYSSAVRMALQEGGRYWHNGFARRVAELIKEGERHILNPNGAMGPNPISLKGKSIGDEAIRDGLKYTFQEKLGAWGSAVEHLRTNIPALHFVMPFVRTPTNIFRVTLEHTPFAPLSKQFRDEIKAGGHRRDTAMAQVIIGTGLGALAYFAAASGLLTGGGDPEKEARRRRRELGIPDYAIKIGDKWVEYRRGEPLGTLLGAAADMAEVSKYMTKEDGEHAAMMVSYAFSNAVLNKTYMSGLNDLLNVLTDPERYAASWEQRMAGSVVPSAVAFSAQSQDPYVRDTRVRGDMDGMTKFMETVSNGVKARLPKTSINPEFNRQSLPIAVDSWGEDRKQDERLFPGAPAKVGRETEDLVRQEAYRLRIKGVEPSAKVQGVKLDAAQYREVAKEGGQLGHDILSALVNTPMYAGLPDVQRRAIFDKVLSEARGYGRAIITPDIIDKIIEKKLKKGAFNEPD